MAISPVSSQSTSATSLQTQEQKLLSQIKSLQSKNADANAAQIKVLQQQYNTLLAEQTQAATPQMPQQKAPKAPEAPTASPATGKGVNVLA